MALMAAQPVRQSQIFPRALAARVAHLIATGTDPERILLLTFSRRAASEMLRRAGTVVDGAAASMVWGGTFHSIGARILRRHAEKIGFSRTFSILDSDDQRSLISKVVKELGVADKAQDKLGEKFPTPAVIASIMGLAANTDVSVK